MKPTRTEMRELLQSDEDKVLRDTWYEYSEDATLPTEDRDELVEAILNLMAEEGDIVEEQFLTLPDLARELNVDPKVARDKMRKSASRGLAPESLIGNGWVFLHKDRAAVAEIIKPRRKK